MNLRVVATAATGALVTAAAIGAAVVLSPAPPPPVCFVQPLAGELGLGHLGLGADASGDLLGRTPLDLRYEYLVGHNPCPECDACTDIHAASPDRRWWGCWQWEGDPVGQFVPDYVRETREGGAVPVFTWYTWLDVSQQDEGADALGALADPEPVAAYFDAYRFFTPDAAPRNREPLSRRTQADREQPGCLHAGMDLYKWAVKAGPLVPGDLLLDTFEHARAVRTLDMRASPYDLRDWGFDPVAVETAAGKAEYVRQQREFAATGARLRERLLAAIIG